MGQAPELRPAHHHPGLDGHGHGPRSGAAGPLRLPPPQGLCLRPDVDRQLQGGQGEEALGLRRRGRRREHARQRAAVLPAVPRRREPHLLLHHAARPRQGDDLAGRAQGRDRGALRALHLRRRLPDGGPRRDPPRDLRHDREALRGHGMAPRGQALEPVLVRRDRGRPRPPRLLEVHGPRSPPLRAGEPVRERHHRLLQVPRREDRPSHREGRPGHGRAGRLRPRREDG